MRSIAFLAGSGRSGSTLLERMLGSSPAAFSAGELRHIWQRGFTDNQLCSCGVRFRDCAFWSDVVSRAFGSRPVDGERVAAIGADLVKRRHLPQLVVPEVRTRRFTRLLAVYLEMLQPLYQAIADVSGSTLIVDSSKDPAYATILRNLTEFDIKLVHLVRDSRAVAYSWQRRRRRPEVLGREEYMVQVRPAGTALSWNLRNLASETLGRSGDSYTRVFYEQLVTYPQATLDRVFSSIGVPPVSALDSDRRVQLPLLYHTVSGNPIRMASDLELRPDVEWTLRMTCTSRWAVTLLTFPLLMRYGYELRGVTLG